MNSNPAASAGWRAPASAADESNEPLTGSRLRAFYRSPAFVPCALLALTVIVFAPELFGPSGTVAASAQTGTDAVQYFGYVREFGFSEMRHGRLPLWNPYIFSGCPFLGGWQEGLLYPLNWIYLFLPLSLAMNCEIAIHVFLAGLGTALWVQRTGAHRLGGLLSGCMVMFGAPFFLHVYAGHLSMIDAMAMAPWLLLAIEGILARPSLRWILLGAVALGMQLLAGHPQTVFITGVTGGIYTVLRLIQSRARTKTLIALVGVGIGALILSAAQLVAGFAATSEGMRSAVLPYNIAATISFPPENFLTLLVPKFFGNMSTEAPYWGRSYLWETSAFVGVIGLMLALYGAFRSKARDRWIWAAMVVITLWIALAAHTPLFHLLYSYVPGFDRFRANAKFIFAASLFIAMLAGHGANAVLLEPKRLRSAALAVACAGATIGVAGVLLVQTNIGFSSDLWTRLTSFVAGTGESYFPAASYANAAFQAQSQAYAARQCLDCAGILIALAAALFAAVTRPRMAYVVVALGVLELALYASSSVGTMDMAKMLMPAGEKAFLAAHPGDYRILELAFRPDNAIGSSTSDIWGYDPTVSERYSEFVSFTQGIEANATGYIRFTNFGQLLGILRCRYAFLPEGSNSIGIVSIPHPLPHVFLARNWTQASGRNAIFAKLASTGFDPAQTAILETSDVPTPSPDAGAGTASVVDSTSDTVTIQADAPKASLLVITDPYSRYWRATGLPGSAQTAYTVLPCDYAVMAIPLPAGHNILRLRYQPGGFVPALWLMGFGWLVCGVLCVWTARRSRTA